MHDLGKFYSGDKFDRVDKVKSEKYYIEALDAFIQLQSLIPTPDSHNFHRRHNLLMRRNPDQSDKLSAYVCYRIGKMYCYGLGTAKDEAEAFKWFEKSAAEGNKFAQFSIGNCYYYDNGTEKSYEKAFLWYMASAEQGQPYAQYALS